LLVATHCVFLVSMDLKISNINDELLNGMDVVLVRIGLPIVWLALQSCVGDTDC